MPVYFDVHKSSGYTTYDGKVVPAYDPAEDPRCIKRESVYRGEFWSKVCYTGCVLDLGEINGRDDSDFYAVIWDTEKQTVRRVEYATTRAACDGSATVDITPENLEAANAWALKAMQDRIIASDKIRCKDVTVEGRVVRVTSSRTKKAKKGDIGIVIGSEKVQYAPFGPATMMVIVGFGLPSASWSLIEDAGVWTLKAPYKDGFSHTARRYGGQWDKTLKVWTFATLVEPHLSEFRDFCEKSFPVRYEKTVSMSATTLEVASPEDYREYPDGTLPYVDPRWISYRGLTSVGLPVY